MPSAPTASPNCVVPGSICGSSVEWSLIASISKNTAPGIWAFLYSASASRLCCGRKYVASTTTTFGSRKWSVSQSVDTSQRLDCEAGGKLSFDMISLTVTAPAGAMFMTCSLVGNGDVRFPLEPFRDRQVFLAQELRVEQLGLVPGAVIGKDRHDCMTGAKFLGEPHRAGNIDAGRA